MVNLGSLPGLDSSGTAYGVSADGSVVVGEVGGENSGNRAFVWTQGTGMVNLGVLPGDHDSLASAVSADGRTIVGFSRLAEVQAFRWTSGSGMVALGDLGGGHASWAEGVTADGSIVVGRTSTPSNDAAFVWTQQGGMVKLFDLLVANGVTGLEGWRLAEATAISADGKWVVGTATDLSGGNGHAFLANISSVPVPPTAWLLGTGPSRTGRQAHKTHSGQ